jgi:large subunit ribosomal protein L5
MADAKTEKKGKKGEAAADAAGASPKPNPMREIKIAKVTVNIGVGAPGERLDNAQKLLQDITGTTPLVTKARVRNPVFKLRKGLPIGVKATLRKDSAKAFLKKAFAAVKNMLSSGNFDNRGNFAFGIREYIDFPGIKYNPEIGMFGFDVCVTLERPGYRVKNRKIATSGIGKRHWVTRDEAMSFVSDAFGVSVQ